MTKLTAVLLLYEPAGKYPRALERLIAVLERLGSADVAVIVVDNARPGDWQHQVSQTLLQVGGDNRAWEFSAFDKGVAACERWRPDTQTVALVTDAFTAYGQEYLELIDDRLIRCLDRLGACAGWMDSYGFEHCRIGELTYDTWMRSSFLFMPRGLLGLVRPFAADLDSGELFGSGPEQPFAGSGLLSDNLEELLLEWLTTRPEPGRLGEHWHSRFELNAESWPLFQDKVRAILREHLISARLQRAGVACYDFRRLRQLADEGRLEAFLEQGGDAGSQWLAWHAPPHDAEPPAAVPAAPEPAAPEPAAPEIRAAEPSAAEPPAAEPPTPVPPAAVPPAAVPLAAQPPAAQPPADPDTAAELSRGFGKPGGEPAGAAGPPAESAAEEAASGSELPEIHHYWANRFLRPKLQRFGCDSPDDFFRFHAEKLCRAAPARRLRFLSLGEADPAFEVELAGQLLARGLSNFSLRRAGAAPAAVARGRRLAEAAGIAGQLDFSTGRPDPRRPAAAWDAVIANQRLHAAAGLEDLLGAIRAGLAPDGYLLVYDAIGRNGGRRWPEALRLIERHWAELPERYRFDHRRRRLEVLFPETVPPVGPEAGGRSQDLLPLLLERFHFELFLGFANVIEPFIGRSFGPNFDPAAPTDRAFIDRVHATDDAALRDGRVKPTRMLTALTVADPGIQLCDGEMTAAFAVRPPALD